MSEIVQLPRAHFFSYKNQYHVFDIHLVHLLLPNFKMTLKDKPKLPKLLRTNVCKNQAADESDHFRISRVPYIIVSFMKEINIKKTFLKKLCFILDF